MPPSDLASPRSTKKPSCLTSWTVGENIFLGHAPKTGFGTIDWSRLRQKSRDVLSEMGAAHINPSSILKELGIANKHLVAVARAMSIKADIVIMDEPTAALSHKEIKDLFDLIEHSKKFW